MTFSKKLLSLYFLLLLPLLYASKPKKCYSSLTSSLTCGPLEVPIRFPFCDHKGFDLYCNDIRRTVLKLPMSGTFLVKNIDYMKQHITIHDPENCLAKRLLTFNVSGSPFSSLYDVEYTFFTCPSETVLPSPFRPVPCLSNTTSTFFTTTDFKEKEPMFRSCQIVKRLLVPATSLFDEIDFSMYLNNQTLLLKWRSPDCTSCEVEHLRCGFENKASLTVKCFADKSGSLSKKAMVIIICVSTVGVIFLNVCLFCLGCYMYNNTITSVEPRQQTVESREMMGTAIESRGLDQSTIDSYKKMQLGDSRANIESVCPICLSEYESNDTVRFIPECDHCFHVECIDVWLKIHGSCPLCRNSNSRA